MLDQPCVDALPGGGNGRNHRRDAVQRRLDHELKPLARVQPKAERAAELEALGIGWDTADAALAAARACHRLHGTLAAPRSAAILDVQIGQ
ncbi:hypothetical protein [Streptomyces vinaceus]|uniref:hypothetical protein n=1 Tax=Streptomyces vinaceus TaxID=1960 RepID=UPI003675167E